MKYLLILATVLTVVAMMSSTVEAQNYSGSSCASGCHSSVTNNRLQYTQWNKTLHSKAYDSIPFVQNKTDCAPCHTTGWDTTLANKGADDYVTRNGDGTFTVTDTTNFKKRKNVGCEDCHGPVQFGTTPPANHPSAGPVAGSLQHPEAESCGKCHDGSHNPYLTEWKLALHSSSDTNASAFLQNMFRSDSNCSACHTYQGFRQWVKDTVNLVAHVNPPGTTAAIPIVCVTCHDPHDATNVGQLRLPADQICQKCHNPEYDAANPVPGTTIHNTTAFMFEGKGGWQFNGFTYESSSHTSVVSRKCVECHVVPKPFVSDSLPASVGHTFMPKATKCFECHSDFDTLATNFNYRGVQHMIDSISAVLSGKLAAASTADSGTALFKQAKFNYDFVQADGSRGIHNTAYATALLTSSIASFNPTGVKTIPGQLPKKYELSQNFPNPFNPSTTISFSLLAKQHVTLRIYDIVGNQVRTLVSQDMGAGSYSIAWDGTNQSGMQVTTGMYLYRIDAGPLQATRKMILMK